MCLNAHWCSAQNSEVLAMEQPVPIQRITVVQKTKFLDVLGGDLQEGDEYADNMNKIWCKKIGSPALPLGVKIQLVHR